MSAKVVAPSTWPLPRSLLLLFELLVELALFAFELLPPTPLPVSFEELELFDELLELPFELLELLFEEGVGLGVTDGDGEAAGVGLAAGSTLGDGLGVAGVPTKMTPDGVATAVGLGLTDGEGDGEALGEAVGLAEGVGLGLAEGDGEAVGLGLVQPLVQVVDHNSPWPGWPGRWTTRNI